MDAFLGMRGAQVRATLKRLGGQRGVEAAALTFHLELVSMTPQTPLEGTRVLVGGQLYVGPEAGGMQYLGLIESATTITFPPGPVAQAQLISGVTMAQLKAIDEIRQDQGVTLTLNLHGHTFAHGVARHQPEDFVGQLPYRIDAGDWVRVLEECGYGQRVVMHLPTEAPPAKPT